MYARKIQVNFTDGDKFIWDWVTDIQFGETHIVFHDSLGIRQAYAASEVFSIVRLDD